MDQLITALESRTLFSASSVTTAQLQVDKQAISNDASALTSALTVFFSQNAAFTSAIATDFRSLAKQDQPLYKQLLKGELKSKATFKSDTAVLDSKAKSAAATVIAAGSALLAHPSVHGLQVLGTDIVKLRLSYAVPRAKLAAHINDPSVAAIRNAIITSVTTDTQLISDLQAQQTEVNENETTIGAAAEKLVVDIGTLATDLTTVKTDVGTYPAMSGAFSGNLTVNAGKLKGQTIPVTLDILSEDSTTGKFTGSLTGVDSSGSDPITGSVTLASLFTVKAATTTQGSLTLSGAFADTTITGKFSSRAGRGLFVLTD
jgi:hypothetical protein